MRIQTDKQWIVKLFESVCSRYIVWYTYIIDIYCCRISVRVWLEPCLSRPAAACVRSCVRLCTPRATLYATFVLLLLFVPVYERQSLKVEKQETRLFFFLVQ